MAATIRIFLAESDPRSLRTAEISNWSGKALAAPRTELPGLLRREELAGAGVYLLTGDDPDSGMPVVYVGEAESLSVRLPAHRSKDFWNNVVVFTSKDENLTKAHVRYLEQRLIELFRASARAELSNTQQTSAKLPESDRADMDVFLGHIQQLLPLLGVSLLAPAEHEAIRDADLRCETKGVSATGCRVPEGFVVRAGSNAVPDLRESAPDVTIRLRRELTEKGVLRNAGSTLEFSRDHIFSSPSAAAAVVHGGSANGLVAWKSRDGRSLKELEADGQA